ncbi:hypothetical protein P343_14375 [Sporolactobacillus laevolacticus DSM 442]|uniref:Uncharacterized protein n=1 Tax=Sporolactobacillus laevolacticus DSM 442 TaxID=1395513 RepID=V6J2L7_9BACL|nr:hypothetical protein P343_14375 [Sporolactobacillus laevolacticus DSM 442]
MEIIEIKRVNNERKLDEILDLWEDVFLENRIDVKELFL